VNGLRPQTAVKLGRVDAEHVEVIRDVTTVGFPNFKSAQERPMPVKRNPAQPVGFIPTSEGVSSGDLTFKVEAGEPAPQVGDGSPGEGFSGAGVFARERLLAIVTSHYLSEGLGSLRLMPLSRVIDLADDNGVMLRAILAFSDLQELDLVTPSTQFENEDDPVLEAIMRDVDQLMRAREMGVITPS